MLLDGTDTKGTERKKEIINEHIVFIDGFKVYRNKPPEIGDGKRNDNLFC